MTELQELDGLLQNPGWLRVRRWIEEEFLLRCLEDIEKAYEITDASERETRIMQIFAGKRTARTIVDWPEKRIARLKLDAQSHTQTVGLTRGGYRA